MTPSADLSPPRRPIFFPVVIATVFLTIIAMTGGYVLGEQQRNDERSSGGGAVTPTGTSESPDPVFTPPGPFCFDPARRTAESEGFTSELWQVLKVHANQTNSTIWVCQDRNGGLFYQSWTNVDRPFEQHKNGLFLPYVKEVRKGNYEVTSPDGNTITVSETQLTVTFADGRDKQVNRVRSIE